MNFLKRIFLRSKHLIEASHSLLFSRLGISSLVFTLCYSIAALFIPPVYLVELGNALVFAFALVNLCLYLPDAIWAARNDKGEAGQYFVVGLSLVLVYLVELRAFSTIWRWLDYPEGWSTHPIHSFFLYVAFFGLTMLMTAPGMQAGRIPIKNWKSVAIGGAFAVFVIGVTVGLFFSGQTDALRSPERGDYVNVICPDYAPIKGTRNNGESIYHIPGSDRYSQTTRPFVCFESESQAQASGFRKPKEAQRIKLAMPINP